MPRKERKLRATKITPLKQELGPPKADETIDVSEANSFQQLCLNISNALRSEKGKVLNCRLKVFYSSHFSSTSSAHSSCSSAPQASINAA